MEWLSSSGPVDFPILLLIASSGGGTCMASYINARCLFSTQILFTVLVYAHELVSIQVYTGDVLKIDTQARGVIWRPSSSLAVQQL